MTATLPAGWKPISSAPKDGTPVLLFARHIDAEASTRVVGWFNDDYGWIAQSYIGQPVARLIPSQWAELLPFPGSPASVAPGDAQDERQAFEAWMASRNLGLLRDGDSYSLTYARRAWEAWQARASLAAPAAGDALDDLTLNQKYEDACILANANARDAGRYRVVRKSIVDEANGSNQVAAASEAIGLERGAYPTPDQFDAIVDHIAAQQGKVGEA